MDTKNPTLWIAEWARRIGLTSVVAEEGSIITIRDKADVLAVPPAGTDQALFLSNGPDFLL